MPELGGTFQVGIVARNRQAMVAFYDGLLDFHRLDDIQAPGAVKRFPLGDVGLKLLVPDDEPAAPNVSGGPTASVAGIRYLTVAEDDVAGMGQAMPRGGLVGADANFRI